uniref:phosphatidylinositol 3,4,5-trisphosphate 3-phosphatase TPTE2 isoform X5 n=1 Tax=Callithrix jacchus TaxID=9483 RepID=UPI0023DCFDE9|nr:phosphatidylinositol 3,4,5-trisphosphate 3-phosphatase TPTE2 isoform X5 [Callithrix jacchus]
MVATQEHPGTSNSMAEQLSRFEDEEGTDVTAYDSKIKKIAHSIVSSFAFGIFGVCLLLLNVGLIFADLIFAEKKIYMPLEYRCISPSIAIFFLMDILLRVFVDGRQHYFSGLCNILDIAIIVITLLTDVIYIFFDFKFLSDIPRWTPVVRHLRLIILTRIVHLVHQKRQLEKLIRRLVSENKRRYVRNGFDLDLTYVTERIIAMSFPSSGRRSYYRNPIEEVVRFLDKKHPNHYRVYNLCSERAYDPKHFHNRVSRILIDDHNVPTLHEMVVFSKEASEWMAQDPENIIAIHCKGGKGRTGTMVCACLIASETFLTAKESLCYFGERRTDKTNSTKFQGVETPSQVIHDAETDRVIIDVLNCPPLYDDVKVQFFSSELPKYYDNCPFFFWFHTSFIQDNRLYLPRNELDNPHKPKTWKIYPPEFAVEIIFEEK